MKLNNNNAKTVDIQRKAVKYLRFLYPIWAIVGLFSIMYVPSTLIVSGDATTTANNIKDNEFLFRSGIVGSLITQLIHVVVVLVLYKLFKTVSKSKTLLVVIFGLVGVPIAMLNTLNRVAALLILNGADYLQEFTTDQLHTLMMLFLNLNEQGVYIASIFWGLWLLPLGYLIYKSGYFPKILGYLVIIAGFGFLLGSFVQLLLPDSEAILSVLDFATFGEVLFMIWVLLKGAKIAEKKSSN